MQQRLQLAHHGADAAGGEEVLHVELVADRLDGGQHRRGVGELVEALEIELEAEAAGDRCQVDHAVGGAAQRQQHAGRILHGLRGDDLVRRQVRARQRDGARARRLRRAQPIGVHGRYGSRAGQRHAERLGNGRHGGGRAHHRAGPGRRHEPALDRIDVGLAQLARAILGPELAAVGTGAYAVILVARGHLWPADQLDRRLAGARCAHQLRRHGLVAAAHQNDRVHRLGADHLLGVHRHEVAELHGVGRQRRLVQRCGRELERETARRRHAALDRLQQLGEVAVAGVELGVRVGDADHGTLELLPRVAHRLGERAPHVDREVAIPVVLQPPQEPALGFVFVSHVSSPRAVPGEE